MNNNKNENENNIKKSDEEVKKIIEEAKKNSKMTYGELAEKLENVDQIVLKKFLMPLKKLEL